MKISAVQLITVSVYCELDALATVRLFATSLEAGMTSGNSARNRLRTAKAVVAAIRPKAQPSRALRFAANEQPG